MCGIAGYICMGEYNPYVEKVFPLMWESSTPRGRDACGFAFEENGKILVHKRCGVVTEDAVNYMTKVLHEKKPRCLLAHVRNGTHGKPEDNRNNHPFYNGSMAMVHNGIVSNYDELKKKYKDKLTGGCDSEVILRAVEDNLQKNVLMAMERANKLLSGSVTYCIVTVEKKLYISVHGNPMHFVYLPDKDIIFFNSDADYINEHLGEGHWYGMFTKMPDVSHVQLVNDRIYIVDYENRKVSSIGTNYNSSWATNFVSRAQSYGGTSSVKGGGSGWALDAY